MKCKILFILIGLIVQAVSAGFSLTVPIGFTGRFHFGENVSEDQYYLTNYIGLECRVGNENEYAIGEFTFNCPLFLLYTINPVDENLQIDLHGIYAKCSFQDVLADCDWFKYSVGPSITSINVDGYHHDINFTGFGVMNELIFFNNFILGAGLLTDASSLYYTAYIGATNYFSNQEQGILPGGLVTISYDYIDGYSFLTIGVSVGITF